MEKTKHIYHTKRLATCFLFLSLLGCSEGSGPHMAPTGKSIDVVAQETKTNEGPINHEELKGRITVAPSHTEKRRWNSLATLLLF